MATTGGVFSVEIRQDASDRYYVYQRVDDQYRHSMTYDTMADLGEVLASNDIKWLEWRGVER